MIDTLQDMLTWALTGPLPWVGFWLVPTWITAYALRMTAPQVCAKGKDYATCYEEHMTHVLLNSARYVSLLGLFWPVLWIAGLGWMFQRSIAGAAAITPTPKPKMSRVDLDKAIEASEKEAQIAKEITASEIWDPPTEGRYRDRY